MALRGLLLCSAFYRVRHCGQRGEWSLTKPQSEVGHKSRPSLEFAPLVLQDFSNPHPTAIQTTSHAFTHSISRAQPGNAIQFPSLNPSTQTLIYRNSDWTAPLPEVHELVCFVHHRLCGGCQVTSSILCGPPPLAPIALRCREWVPTSR